MNNNDNSSNDPILDWILKPETAEETNRPISPELLSYLLTQDVNTSLVTPQALPQQTSPEITSSANLTSSPSEEDDEPTDAQLKLMPSKERRQLRNKISARNFRNRRKEYMSTLEAELEQCKAENSQLKHEVKWVRGMMDKLQAENDKLRLNLVLCKEGIEPTHKSNEALNITSTTPPDIPSMINSNTNNWELLYPTNNTMLNHNVYLAHASMPNWDMSSIFEKNSNHVLSEETDLIHKYPLLAPALMSIVLSHTMTMTTDQIIANSTLYDPTWATKPNDKSLLSNSVVWQNLLQSHQNQITTDADDSEQKEQEKEELQKNCPLYWIQKRFCNFIISYVVVRYPHLDARCRTYLPICEKYRK
ncbi:hypothetical protein BDF21DRAFT_497896 [Thamnidium elegans]|nr:hypothetical protein BDF21DRAFT_497896 [Thamnidium elegans]